MQAQPAQLATLQCQGDFKGRQAGRQATLGRELDVCDRVTSLSPETRGITHLH